MYKVTNNEFLPTEELTKNFWIHLTNPTDDEIKRICEQLQLKNMSYVKR